jgi:hypothetical protein
MSEKQSERTHECHALGVGKGPGMHQHRRALKGLQKARNTAQYWQPGEKCARQPCDCANSSTELK